MLFPIKDLSKGRYNSKFGYRVHPITEKRSKHRGIDVAMNQGTELMALENGVIHINKVNGSGINNGYGNYLVIKYDNGYYSLYAHLKQLSKFRVGTRVNKGQVVAYSGNTGSSTGPHLHFEIHKGAFLFGSQVRSSDTAINPINIYPDVVFNMNKSPYYVVVSPPKVDESKITKPKLVSDWAKDNWNTVIKEGYLDGTRPREGLTREELASVIVRILEG